MMSDILESILSGRVAVNDLLSYSSENSGDLSDFVPYFLNYVKENCAWLILKSGKSFQSPASKYSQSPSEQQFTNRNYPSYKSNTLRNFPAKNINKDYGRNKMESRCDDVLQPFSEGIKYNVKTTNRDAFEEPKRNYQYGIHKSEYSARKCLNFQTMKRPKNNVLSNQNGHTGVPDINSFDAFPPVGSADSSKSNDFKIRRRITPTPLQATPKGTSTFGSVRFSSPVEKICNEAFKRTPFMESPSSDLETEREMLKMTRNKISQLAITSNGFSSVKKENVSPTKSLSLHYVTPDPEFLTHQSELEIFSHIYDLLITNGLISNVITELYFMFELITSKILPNETTEDESNVFCSIHNCVYFAVSVLSKQQNLLHVLDYNTLSSLCEIPYLPKFSLQLINFLQNCCKEKQEIIAKTQSLNRVPFLIDEDSKDNFIDAHAFSSFRKQRDLFYELLREWQHQSLACIDAKFREKFSHKAKLLINLGPNIINIHHLARLFQNQLIASCLGLEVNEVYDEILSDIQRNFPDKVEKLCKRFIMPYCTGEPNPPPTFYGIQSFFSELIQAIDSTLLNQQLQDVFICKILDLNDSDLSLHDCVKEKYIFLLHTLRLLGKFFGYLCFLPYQVSQPLSANIVNYQLISRKCTIPPLDILKLLKEAIEKNRILLTVPWIVEYLSMADPVARNLAYIEETLEILTAIYRGKYLSSFDSLSFWFLRVIIGWLFGVLNYPMKYCSLVHADALEKNKIHEGIDSLSIIDKQLIYSCCPYLIEFKILIYNFLNGIKGNRKEVRKITPLSTTKPQIPASFAKQQIETQLEENFFFFTSTIPQKDC